MKVLFLHGWQSTPGGLKPTYLKSHGHTVLNPALPDDDFDAAVHIAQTEFDLDQPDIVVGSSRGGAVAMNIDTGDTPLVLLCPAWKRWGTANTVKPNTIILHSEQDDVVPFADSQELLRNSGLPESALIVVGTEHRLADPESLRRCWRRWKRWEPRLDASLVMSCSTKLEYHTASASVHSWSSARCMPCYSPYGGFSEPRPPSLSWSPSSFPLLGSGRCFCSRGVDHEGHR